MLDRSINFLMSGDGHAQFLVVALHTLRHFYGGRVVIHAYPESMETVSRIADDKALYAEYKLWNPTYRGKNGQFVQKIQMMQQIDTETGIYLDADIIVRGSIDELFERAESCGFVATQFNRWLTNEGTIKRRLSGLVGRKGIDQTCVQWLLTHPCPSVNGGVFACLRNSEVLPMWHEATMGALDLFIADETVLHTFTVNPALGVNVMKSGRWNCSPKYQPPGLPDKDVVIWHGHGDSFVRPNKSMKGLNMWWEEFMRCRLANIGGINEWLPKALDKNRFLKALEQDND